MKSQPVEFLESVEHDLRYARDFYESWLLNGGRDFMKKFHDCISWIEWNPEMFPKKHRQFRRAIIRKSYFGIYYIIEPEVSTVAAVLDMRRDPRIIRSILLRRQA